MARPPGNLGIFRLLRYSGCTVRPGKLRLMPDPFERHSRPGRWDYWSSRPSRSAARAAAAADDPEPARRPPGRKSGARCKGNKGGPHIPVIEADRGRFRTGGCRWGTGWDSGSHAYAPVWRCCHQEVCENCGKIFQARIPPEKCPGWEAGQAAYPAALAEAERVSAEHAARRRTGRHRGPVREGPLGYRRPKGGSG